MVDFCLRLKQLRQQKHLTQQQLAERLGVTKSVVSAYENESRMPSYAVLLQISYIFHVSTDYLLGREIMSDNSLDITGLADEEKAALRQLVSAMLQQKRN